MKTPLYREIAATVLAMKNCEKSGNLEWKDKHKMKLERIEKEYLPSGSGFDCGTTIDLDKTSEKAIYLYFDFHNMNEHGMYCGWTHHTVKITPSFDSFDLKISGRNKNGIVDYFYDTFNHVLSLEIEKE